MQRGMFDKLIETDFVFWLKQFDVIYREPTKGRSGKLLEYYVDIKKVYGHPEALEWISDQLYNRMDKRANCIAAAGYGGLPPAAVIASKYHKNLIMIRDEEKKHGKGGLIDGYFPSEKDLVAVVDDVLTTGGSLQHVTDVIKPTGAEIIDYCVVCKRGESPTFDVKYIFRADDLIN